MNQYGQWSVKGDRLQGDSAILLTLPRIRPSIIQRDLTTSCVRGNKTPTLYANTEPDLRKMATHHTEKKNLIARNAAVKRASVSIETMDV